VGSLSRVRARRPALPGEPEEWRSAPALVVDRLRPAAPLLQSGRGNVPMPLSRVYVDAPEPAESGQIQWLTKMNKTKMIT